MFRKSRRRRRSGPGIVKTIVVGVCVLTVLSVVLNELDAVDGQQAAPYVLAGAIAFWIFGRVRRPRTAQSPARLRTRRHRASTGIDQLHGLSPYEFEAYVRELLLRLGFRDLRLNGGPGDLGVDIWGRTPQGMTAAIQCKRYAPGKNIGSQAMQTFIGMQKIHHGADVGLFVTTSGFTPEAMRLAQAHGIQLIDGPALLRLQRRARMHQRRRFGFLRR